MVKIKLCQSPSVCTIEMADLERLVKKYKFKEAIPLVEALQSKLKG